MTPNTVSWRHVVAALLAVVAALGAVVVIVRSDGVESVDAATARATRWFVHQPTGRVVLIDGFGGRPLASLDTEVSGEPLTIAQGAAGAFLINDATAETRAIDTVELRLGSPLSLPTLGRGDALTGVGQVGLVVVDPLTDAGSVVPADGETIGFDVVAGAAAVVAPDGGVWSVVDGGLRRTTSTSVERYDPAVIDGELSLLGNTPVLLDRDARRVLVGVDGVWQQLPTDVDPSELVLQQPGPPGRCAWVGSGDTLWCVSARGIDETATVAGLGAGGGDTLAIAGDAAALVERGPTAVVRFDWRRGEILDDVAVTVRSDANLSVASTVDLVWVDDVAGDFVWAVNPWGIEAVDKNAMGILVLGEDGDVVDEGESNRGSGGEADESSAVEPEEREPDDNGVDDPPVAMPDAVTARTGASVAISVIANDYDPDGEAIVVSEVGRAAHGSVEIGTASTVVYTPQDGYVGLDEFTYTIVDGNGSSAESAVVVELLPVDATNGSPVGIADEADTGPGVAVVVDVLRNDVDPERDSLSIGSFAPPDGVGASAIGEVTETVGPSGLPALRFAPSQGFEGTARFTYRPLDVLDALGDDVEVTVEVASSADANRPPMAQPDALRLRRGVRTVLPVLVNDIDPDGDRLELDVVEPLPDGLLVEVEGQQLAVTAGPGATELLPFEYVISDGFDHTARGAVLVGVIDDIEPNRPPVVTADTAKAVVGESVVLDVLVNDVDPDGDPLVIVEATSPEGERGRVDVLGTDRLQFTPATLDDDELNARFSYTVSDGNGHEVSGDVTVTVLPEALAAPPFARDDSTFTFVDTPVTIDVLRNDGDPSGSRPTLAGRPGCPAGGMAVVTVDNQVRFDPPAGRSGAFRCTYEVSNARGLRASASIVISVRQPQLMNEPPNAVSDRLTVEQETTASIDVTSNDTDPDGDDAALTVVSSTAPSLGTAVRDGKTITFTAGLELGPALINYQVRDADGAISLGRLSVIVVEPINEPPIALPDQRTVFGPGGPTGFAPLDNDVDPDDTVGGLELVSVELVAGDGSATRSGSLVTMTPAEDFVGDLVADYTIADGEGLTASSVITLSVLEPLNRAPEAVNDLAEVANGGTVTTAILFNDIDPDGDPLEVNLLGGPSPDLGSASLNGDRSVTFTADPGASGTTSIPYQISDGEFTSSAALSIVVLPCTESAPVAQDAFIETGYQQPVAVDLAVLSTNGTIVDVASPAGLAGGVYSPPPGENGNVTVTYGVVNGCRQRASGVVTIDVNQPPAVQPQAFRLGRGAVQEVPVGSLASDDEALSIADVVGAPGWVGVADGVVLIRPDEGAPRGITEFSIVVADPGGLTGTVPIAVTVTNASPVANADQIDVSSGNPATIDLTANDTDPDGPDGQLRVREVPSTIVFTDGRPGSVALSPDGRSVSVDPGDAEGTATFSYVVEDADGDRSSPATVTVAGPQINQSPFARDQVITVEVDIAEAFVLDAGDPDGDQVSIDEFDDPAGVVSTRDGLRVTVDTDDTGTYSFTYRVTDGSDLSPIATVTVTVIPEATTTTTTTTTVPSTNSTDPPPTSENTVATPTTETVPTPASTTTASATATSVEG
ncbi:MAG: Ig-like domain-containing protein [Actinomycetota bacterium]